MSELVRNERPDFFTISTYGFLRQLCLGELQVAGNSVWVAGFCRVLCLGRACVNLWGAKCGSTVASQRTWVKEPQGGESVLLQGVRTSAPTSSCEHYRVQKTL